jgi:CelD/BcsL family acetyltransferase involved in cellulose biosynthesis
MDSFSFPAHFDGEQVRFDAPIQLEPNTKLIVTVVTDADAERAAWQRLAESSLSEAFGDDEPDYSLNLIKEANPEYEGR